MLLRRLRFALLGLALVLFGGTLGYVLVEGWTWIDSLWMVVITLSTVGYGEPAPLSTEGRVFTMVLIFGGLSLATYSLSEVARFVADGGLLQTLRDRRRSRIMKTLSDHFIVVGFGRLGKEVTAEIEARGHSVVVIDTDARRVDLGTVFVEGDASSDEVLRQAGIAKARGLTACTGNDATNLFVVLSARQLNPQLQIVCRVDDEQSVQKALRAGASTVLNPYGISGQRMAQGLLQPVAASMVDRTVSRVHDDFNLEDVPIGDRLVGSVRKLRVAEDHNIMVVGIMKKDGRFQRGFDRRATLESGDVAVVAGKPEDIRRFAERVAPEETIDIPRPL
ncbi:MAG: potassium channel protein [Myxococcota bacterium]